jgi:long-subunit fatty acid transport protein
VTVPIEADGEILGGGKMKHELRRQAGFRYVVLLAALMLLCPAAGYSLDNSYWNTGLNFRFYPPGARALGMGGAFVGLADDTTAAASNPAGLAQLTRMQLAIEGRYISNDGEQSSFPFGIFDGRVRANSDIDDVGEISFGAFSTPLFDNMFNLAVFYDKPMSYSSTKDVDITFPGFPTFFQTIPSSTDIDVNEVGLSLAKGFADGRIMLGFGVGLNFFDMQANETIRVAQFGPPYTFQIGSVDESDQDLSYRLGILVKPIDNLRLGASFTSMPRFDTKIKGRQYNALGDLIGTAEFDSEFDIPDNFSFGAAYNILPNWVTVFEAKYVRYSQLKHNFAANRLYYGSLTPDSSYDIDDIVELHFGTEYVLSAIKDIPIALRAGLFYEPSHDLEYSGSDPIQRGMFDGGDDLMHFTVGTGAVFYNHFQVDLGADFNEDGQNVTLSMVYQF